MSIDSAEFNIIGIAHTPYKQKFGIPRQPALVPEITGTIEIFPPFDREEAFRGLDTFSHLWVSFIFHAIKKSEWQPMVRPPRLGGNKKVGVFASRSTHRPNPLGLSVVKLDSIENTNHKISLKISGHDLLDQSPIIDIKPYLPYADSIPQAARGYAPEPEIDLHQVTFSSASLEFVTEWEDQNDPSLKKILVSILQQDPRPAYSKDDPTRQSYGMQLYNLDIQFSIENKCVKIEQINPI